MNCTTHHHACDCRERQLLATLRPIAAKLCDDGIKGNQVAFEAFVDINEMWRELYSVDICHDKRFTRP